MTPAVGAVLTNAEVIAVDQDVLGYQGYRVRHSGMLEVWSKPLVGNAARAVALLNRGTTAANIAVSWTEVGLAAGPASVRDVWKHEELGEHAYGISVLVEPDATVLKRAAARRPRPAVGRSSATSRRPTLRIIGARWSAISATANERPVMERR